MRNSNQPRIIIREYPYAEAYQKGKSYYALCTATGAWSRCKNAEWACHEAQEMNDAWARHLHGKTTREKTQ